MASISQQQRIQTAVSAALLAFKGAHESLLSDVRKQFGAHCAVQLRDTIVKWNDLSDTIVRYNKGTVVILAGVDGDAPEFAVRDAELMSVFATIHDNSAKEGEVIASAYDDKPSRFMFSRETLAAWLPTVSIFVTGAQPLRIKCRSEQHMRQVRAVCRSAVQSDPAFSSNWRSSILRAIQSLSEGFDTHASEPLQAV